MTVLEMKQKRANLVKKSREAYEAFMESKGAEDKSKYEAIESELESLEWQIAEGEKHEARKAELDKAYERQSEAVAPVQEETPRNIRETDDYKRMFETYLAKGTITSTLAEAMVNGAYLVPQSYENTIREKKRDLSVMRRIADVMTVSGDAQIPLEGSIGASEWIAESGAYPNNDITMDKHLFQPHKLGRIIPIPEELLADSNVDVEGYVARKFAQSNAILEDTAFFSGNGTAKPYGVLEDATNAQTAAAVAAITYSELLDVYYAVDPAYQRNGSWVMNQTTLKAIRQLKDGSGNWLFQPGVAVDRIEGKPVYLSSDMPELAATNKVVAFGDFSQYQIVDRTGFTMQRLVELYAGNGQVGYRGYSRTDGKLLFADAVQTLTMAAS